MGNVKLKDIAERLSVSAVTVSNALSGKKGVSDEVREKIFRTAKEMGYNLEKYEKRSKGNTIGVIVAEKYLEMGVSFYWSMYQQVACAAAKNQSITMLETLNSEKEENGLLPTIVKERSIDGLIIIGWVKKDYIQKILDETTIPVVQLDFAAHNIPCDAVISSNYIGMYRVTRYLVDKGHQDIAFVGSIRANENIMDRYFGYRKALEEKGIKPRKGWLLEDRDLKSGEVAVTLPENMPSAFACNSDLTASRVYDALVERGYRIPEDVSIVAYDNYLFGHPFARQLTTYNVDMKRMAEGAVKVLMGKFRGVEKRYGTRYIDSVIVERGSVKDLNA